MIEDASGNLIEAEAEALVNTVNTVGVMGKGIALQFRQAFPDNYAAYRRACHANSVVLGKMFVTRAATLPKQWIINFPTKRDWRSKSHIADIENGLRDLTEVVRRLGIKSIAVPPLGCGNGGLDWNIVRPLIEQAFLSAPEVRVLLYAPAGAPAPKSMRVTTKPPHMTLVRASILALLHDYALLQGYTLLGYELTLLEIQKLSYFLQAAGEPLKINFVRERYGPYAAKLEHVVQGLEGHYLRGYGDRSQQAAITVLPNAMTEAGTFLHDHPQTEERIKRVQQLIEGFENPHGMELLATVHWLAKEDLFGLEDVEAAVTGVHAWNERKRNVFPRSHIEAAWVRLREQSWI